LAVYQRFVINFADSQRILGTASGNRNKKDNDCKRNGFYLHKRGTKIIECKLEKKPISEAVFFDITLIQGNRFCVNILKQL